MKLLNRSILLFIVFASFAAMPCMAAEKPNEKAAKQEISGLIKESAEKKNKLDVEGGLKHIHPTDYSEYTHIPQKPLVGIDKKSLVGICKAIFPSLKLKIGPALNLKVVIKGDMAYATYHSTEQFGDAPPIMVRRTEIFVRENKDWLLTHSHRSILSGE